MAKPPPKKPASRGPDARRVFANQVLANRVQDGRLPATIRELPQVTPPSPRTLKVRPPSAVPTPTAAEIDAHLRRLCRLAAPAGERRAGEPVQRGDLLMVSALAFRNGAAVPGSGLSRVPLEEGGPRRALYDAVMAARLPVERGGPVRIAGADAVPAVMVHHAHVPVTLAPDSPEVLGLVDGLADAEALRGWVYEAVARRLAVQHHVGWVHQAWEEIRAQVPVPLAPTLVKSMAARLFEAREAPAARLFGLSVREVDALRAKWEEDPAVLREATRQLHQQALVLAWGRTVKVPEQAAWLDRMAREATVDLPASLGAADELRAQMEQSADEVALWWAAAVERAVALEACPTAREPETSPR